MIFPTLVLTSFPNIVFPPQPFRRCPPVLLSRGPLLLQLPSAAGPARAQDQRAQDPPLPAGAAAAGVGVRARKELRR